MKNNKIPENIIDLVDGFNQKKISRKTFLYTGKEHSYSKLYEHILKYTGLFREKGLKKGDKVLVSSNMDIAFIEAHLSLMRNGLVSVPIDPDTKQNRITKLIEFLNPKGIIADKNLIESWNIPENLILLQVEEKADKGMLFNKLLGKKQEAGKVLTYPAVLESYPDQIPPIEIDPGSDAYILFTSGTTSEPRGIRISHSSLYSQVKTLSGQFLYTGESKALNLLPLFHTGGLTQGLMITLAVRGTLFRHLEFSFQTIEKFLDSIYTYKISHVHTVPTMISLMLEYGKGYQDAFNTEYFKVLTCGGSVLRPDTWKKFEDQFGVRISNFYGLTETVTGTTYCGPDDETYKMGTIGKPVDCQVKIILDDRVAGVHEVGEILLAGDHIMKGYYNAPDLSDQVLKDGWFYSGDLGKYDEEGFYYIEGRKKLLIITGGINVLNAEVEEVILGIDGIKDAVVLGEEDLTWGEIVVAAVVVHPEKELSEKGIVEECRKVLEQVKIPRKVYFLDEIPRTKSGKVIPTKTREIIASKVVDAMDHFSGDMEERVLKVASESFRLDPGSLSLDSDNRNLDEWDSLSHLVLVSNLEQEFNVRFATVEIMKIESLQDALNIIREK